MNKFGFRNCFIIILIGSIILTGNFLFAKEKGPPVEVIKAAYQQILSGADKNGDGKISMDECMSISSNKSKIEKDCRYWDENGDGYITEEEYVKQVRNTMK